VVSAGQTQQVWVHTLARARVTLKVDYGNGQVLTRHGPTDQDGEYLFQWTVGYTGSVVVLAHYWVYVVRGPLSTATRGHFVLFPAPPLQVRLEVLTPSLHVGDTLRVRVHSRPGASLSLSVRRADGSRLLTRRARADGTGDWLVSAPVSATVTRPQRLRIVVRGDDLGRHTSAVGVLTLRPRPVLWNTITPVARAVGPRAACEQSDPSAQLPADLDQVLDAVLLGVWPARRVVAPTLWPRHQRLRRRPWLQ
jgi:hypothetical protein